MLENHKVNYDQISILMKSAGDQQLFRGNLTSLYKTYPYISIK